MHVVAGNHYLIMFFSRWETEGIPCEIFVASRWKKCQVAWQLRCRKKDDVKVNVPFILRLTSRLTFFSPPPTPIFECLIKWHCSENDNFDEILSRDSRVTEAFSFKKQTLMIRDETRVVLWHFEVIDLLKLRNFCVLFRVVSLFWSHKSNWK